LTALLQIVQLDSKALNREATMEIGELIGHWRLRVHRMQLAHYDSEALFSRRHLWLGLPVILLSTIVGTSVFSTLQKTAQTPEGVNLRILVGMLSVAAAALAGLQTFLRYAERAEKHRVAGARFASLKTKIELVSCLPPTKPDELEKALSQIQKSWTELSEETPAIPPRIWRKVESRMPYDDEAKKYAMHSGFGQTQ
jgi:hypothetical protein